MKRAATWIGFTLAAVSAVWGGEAPAPAGKGPPKVGGEVEIANVPFDVNEVIRTVRKNRGLPEETPRQGFRAEARGERPFSSKGGRFTHSTPRFQAEIDVNGLRYFAQGSKEKPDFEILSVSFEGGGNTQTVFGKGRLEEHAPGLLKGEARGGVTPYVRNRGEDGIEIYWTIDGPLSPEASALRVRLAIRAAGEPQVFPEGLVFPAWREEGQVTLSNVTVADSGGTSYRVESYRVEDLRNSQLANPQTLELVAEIPAGFIASARYPILIDPTVGPEFLVEPSPVIGPASGEQYDPSVASNGTNYFVAWHDLRGGSADIYGTRVAPDGTVLDLLGIVVSTAVGAQQYPSVASNGTDYFMAWYDGRSGADWDIYGTRVASDGTVLDPTPTDIAVSTAATDQSRPSVASDGTDYFVAWYDYRSGVDYDIYGTRVASDGTVLDPTPTDIAVSTATNHQMYPSVASNGTNYFVAWEDQRNGSTNRDVYGARVTLAGAVPDDPLVGIAVSTAANHQYEPSVASDGSDYFVAWYDRRSGTNNDIYGARVTSAGAVPDDPLVGIAVSTAATDQRYPSVASNGTDYFVAWEDWRNGSTNRDVYGARVTSAGAVPDDPLVGIAVSTAANNQRLPSVASNGTDYFVVWQDYRSGTGYSDIYGTRVTSAGAVPDDPLVGIAVSTSASEQRFPSVASNGTDYFVVWEDYREGPADIYGARVTAAGVVLDASGIAVSTAVSDQEDLSVASNGTDYFVAWRDYRSGTGYDIYGTRVTSAGAVPDDPLVGIAVSTAASSQRFPSVASDGTDYFVVWEDRRYWATTKYDIYGTRVRASDGWLLDGPPDTGGIAVSTAANSQYSPSAASNGTDYFVVWEDYRDGPGNLYGARVTAAGVVLDTSGIAVSTAAWDQEWPSVASNGTDYFAAWRDYRNDAGCFCNPDIYGTRVTSDGMVLDAAGIAVSTAANWQVDPSVASNEADYFVVWMDGRSGTDYDIYGARVTSLYGTVLDAAGILIQQSPYGDSYPAVAYSACGKYLVTYYRFYDDPNFQSSRVMALTVEDDVPSAGEVSAQDSGKPLTVERASGQVKIFWEGLPSDCAGVIQYNIYEGNLDAPFYTHLSAVCWTAGTDEEGGYLSEIITPGYTNAYYLVTECDMATEGPSGYDSDAVERNPLLNTCGPHP